MAKKRSTEEAPVRAAAVLNAGPGKAVKPAAGKKAAAAATGVKPEPGLSPAAAVAPIARSTAVKAASKPAVVPKSNGAASAAGADAAPAAKATEKIRKTKLVRDSFTMPEPEYEALAAVKKACVKAGVEVKKSELLRVGLGLIRKLDIAELKQALAALPPLKAGRRATEK